MTSLELLVALLTLSTLEIVLGVDNLVFISIAVGRLPQELRPNARRFGLALACVTRVALLVVLVMIFASNPVGEFIDRNPTIRMLALAFIMMIGVVLIGEGIDVHIPRGYIYFAMGFSAAVEILNLRAKREKGRRYHRRAEDQEERLKDT